MTVYLGIHRDVTDRERAEEGRERSARRHAAVAAMGLRALASADLAGLIDEATTVCAAMLGVDFTAIAEVAPGRESLVLRARHGWRTAPSGATAAVGLDSFVGYAVSTGAPVISGDLASDPRFSMSPCLTAEAPVSGAGVVIAGYDEPFGVLAGFTRRRRSFSADDLGFLQSLANVLATAAERARAEREVLDVKEAERRRIARSLHDEALQDLSATIAVIAAASPGDAWTAEPLIGVAPTLKRVACHLRAAVFDLRLVGEEGRPFTALLRELVESQRALADASDIRVEIGAGVPAGPLDRVGTECLRITAEAVINARRHAGATNIRVTARGSARRLIIEVSDDGCGFDPATAPAIAATGLTGMRERAELLDADLSIASSADAGTVVRLDVPLTRDGDPAHRGINVMLVEDHAAVRQAIAAVFQRERDLHVVAQAASLAEARTMLADVDVAVIDVGLPDGDGTGLIAELRRVNPRAQAVVLTASPDRSSVARAVERGAAAVLHKAVDLDELLGAVRRLHAGQALIPAEDVVGLLRFAERTRARERADRAAIEDLTAREREILQALGEGLTTEAVAQRFHIATRTARNHVAGILGKLGVQSRLQAVLFAARYGAVEIR